MMITCRCVVIYLFCKRMHVDGMVSGSRKDLHRGETSAKGVVLLIKCVKHGEK